MHICRHTTKPYESAYAPLPNLMYTQHNLHISAHASPHRRRMVTNTSWATYSQTYTQTNHTNTEITQQAVPRTNTPLHLAAIIFIWGGSRLSVPQAGVWFVDCRGRLMVCPFRHKRKGQAQARDIPFLFSQCCCPITIPFIFRCLLLVSQSLQNRKTTKQNKAKTKS